MISTHARLVGGIGILPPCHFVASDRGRSQVRRRTGRWDCPPHSANGWKEEPCAVSCYGA